jgi:hypothetical protein
MAQATEIIFTIDPSQSTQVFAGEYPGYGSFVPQTPGSLSAPVSGHFLVSFDPSTSTPATLQFIGGHGYWQPAMSHLGLPGPGGSGTPALANFAGDLPGGVLPWSIRDLVYDFSSPVLSGSGGVFPATTTSFTVTSGGMEAGAGFGFIDYVGSSNQMDSGVSTAQFTPAANTVTVAPTETHAEALGGSTSVGGVSADFSGETSGGNLSVQQVPNNTALSQAAVEAAETNNTFAVSTSTLEANPQIWNVDFDGDLQGATATLVFAYDPALLPVGVNETDLGIWHFNSILDDWEFGGTVDTLANTVTFVTDSFSPFMLGVAVPEPATISLLLAGVVAIIGLRTMRRR